MKKLWQSLASQLGWQGMLGGLLLLAAYLFYSLELAPLELRAEVERARTETGQQRMRGQPSSASLEKFYAFFEGGQMATDQLDTIYRLAEANALKLKVGEYKLEDKEGDGLKEYQISLPVHGSYLQVRAFVTQVLEKMPTVSLDRILLRREHADSPTVDAEIQFTLYMRPDGPAS